MLVFLTGYRGSGKTTVGKLLADQLGLRFIDLDQHLSAAAGKDIRDIFESEGEVGFRDRETHALRELASTDAAVIALGGGAMLRDENRRLIPRHRAVVIYLSSDATTLQARIHGDPATVAQRPALTALGGTLAEIETLLAKRDRLYREVMTHEIDVTMLTPEAVAERAKKMMNDER